MTGSTICLIGPGGLGEPMVERLVAAGHRVTTSSSRAEARSRLRGVGARVVASPSRAAAHATVCIVVVFSEEQLDDVLAGGEGVLAALPPGCLVISHVTSSISGVQRTRDRCARAGLRFVDAPVSGDAGLVSRGELTVLLGGAPGDVAAARSLVSAYAGAVFATGPVGSATRFKLINNALFAAQAQLAEAAIRELTADGTSRSTAVAALCACSGGRGALAYLAQRVDVSFEDASRYLRKDVSAMLDDPDSTWPELDVVVSVIGGGPLALLENRRCRP